MVVQLWVAEEVLTHNAGYEVGIWHPGHFGFGSSGGGVMFAFREGDADRVYGVPFDSRDPEDIYVVASTLREFAAALGKRGDDASEA